MLLPGCPFAACLALSQGNDDQSLPCVKGGGSPQGETEGLPAAGYVVMSCAVLGAAIPQPLRGSSLYTREPLSLLLPGWILCGSPNPRQGGRPMVAPTKMLISTQPKGSPFGGAPALAGERVRASADAPSCGSPNPRQGGPPRNQKALPPGELSPKVTERAHVSVGS